MKRTKCESTKQYVEVVPSGLLFYWFNRDTTQTLAMAATSQFVPCSRMQADEYIRENCP